MSAGLTPTPLAQQQQALLGALFARPAQPITSHAQNNPIATKTIAACAYFTGARGLKAYQSNGHALAERTLQATYPVIAQLLGDDSFPLLARDFWHDHPPVRGDLTQWGGELADFLQTNTQLADEPYLGDVARVEWALHRAASAADRQPDPASFALLSTGDPDGLRLILSTGTEVISSVYPVAGIVTAHLNQSPALDEVGRRLRAGVKECAMVWRQGYKPLVAECSPAGGAFLQATLSGASLLSALEQAGEFNFSDWLPAAVQSGLVLGVQPIESNNL